MVEEPKVNGKKNDRLLSLLGLITGAAGFLSIVFACLDWSHASLSILRWHSFNLLLFAFSLASFFVTYLIGLWLLTHDKGRIRYAITRAGGALALSAIAAVVVGFAAGYLR